jgi:hypothetical protein
VIGVVGTVCEEALEAPDPAEQGAREADIVDVAGRQEQDMGSATDIAQGVELARFAPARLTERLEVGPPFAPPAERCALM